MATFDTRPVLAAGGEPFNDIMAAVAALREDEELVVLAPFGPVPLEGVLSSRGFPYDAVDLGDSDWRVTFRRASCRDHLRREQAGQHWRQSCGPGSRGPGAGGRPSWRSSACSNLRRFGLPREAGYGEVARIVPALVALRRAGLFPPAARRPRRPRRPGRCGRAGALRRLP